MTSYKYIKDLKDQILMLNILKQAYLSTLGLLSLLL